MSGPQFSSQPNSSKEPLLGIGGEGPGGPGLGAGGPGVGGKGGVGGPGGAGGGVGAGAGGTCAQSAFPLHFVLKSALHNPPVPPCG